MTDPAKRMIEAAKHHQRIDFNLAAAYHPKLGVRHDE